VGGWVDAIERLGIYQVRKIPGFHDEPLKGGRKWQRSIRLNKAYRAIYVENQKKEVHLISVIEVNKHEY
jgi:proteic killer suppression protein